MKSELLLALVPIALFAEPATSEIFKCVDASGNVTFVNDRSACPDAKPHPLKGRVESVPSSTTLAEEAVPDRSEISSPEQRLEWALLDEGDVRFGWKIVNETPSDPRGDADLVEWGVVAQRTRHYTSCSGRSRTGVVEPIARSIPIARSSARSYEREPPSSPTNETGRLQRWARRCCRLLLGLEL